ncbi:MAG TPA: hypothetical protein DHV48_00275 [Prolixibacteraceae bacterium]|nr:hypothetical protein [Prolixibacteraceae bacterium]
MVYIVTRDFNPGMRWDVMGHENKNGQHQMCRAYGSPCIGGDLYGWNKFHPYNIKRRWNKFHPYNKNEPTAQT